MKPRRFAEYREEAGLTQGQLADMLGMSVRAIAAWESGERKPPLDKLEWLADYYCISIDSILGRPEHSAIAPSAEVKKLENLKKLRKQQKLRQKDMADFLGVERTTYVKYESGQSEPPLRILCKLADHFQVSVDYLIDRTDVPSMNVQPPMKMGETTVELLSTQKSLPPEIREQAEHTVQSAIKDGSFVTLQGSAELEQLVRKIASEVFQEQYKQNDGSSS